MKRENCECGASIQLTRDGAGRYDDEIIDLFNQLHAGAGHDRVTAWEANQVRNYYTNRGSA